MARLGTSNINLGTWLDGENPGAGSQSVDSTGLNGNWSKLDKFGVEHNADGTHKAAVIDGANLKSTAADGSTLEQDATTKKLKIKDLGVSTGKIADNAVTTLKIADGQITAAKLAATQNVTFGTVTCTTLTATGAVSIAAAADSKLTGGGRRLAGLASTDYNFGSIVGLNQIAVVHATANSSTLDIEAASGIVSIVAGKTGTGKDPNM